MILEGLVTTLGPDGNVNLAPMGPTVDDQLTRLDSLERLVLRPFHTSTTFANLQRTGAAVFHITDDVELLARAAVDRCEPLPDTRPATHIAGQILVDCCRWFELRVDQVQPGELRTSFECSVVASGHQRDFLGFNRASHAVLEAAIVATRVHLIAATDLTEQLERLETLVEKTAGAAQRRAFEFLRHVVAERMAEQ